VPSKSAIRRQRKKETRPSSHNKKRVSSSAKKTRKPVKAKSRKSAQTVNNDQSDAVAGISTDLTERKKEEFEQRFTQFSIEESPDSIFWVDFDGRIQHVNKAACQSLGYTLEEMKNLTVPDIDLDFPKEFFKKFSQQLKKEKSMYLYGTQKRKDGSTFPIEVRPHYIEFEGREYMCAFTRDITHRKELENELLFSHYSIENAPAFLVWIDEGARFHRVNESFLKYFGYNRTEILSMVVSDIDSNFPAHKWPKFWERLKKEGRLKIETQIQKKDDHLIPVEILVHFISFEGKDYACAFGFDIAERKQAEDALEKYANELETKNLALKEILSQIEIEKKLIGDAVTVNAEKLVLPLIHKIRQNNQKGNDKVYALLEKNVREIATEYGAKRSAILTKLSPKEIEICNLIKNGFESKEISDLLGISNKTVETHRTHIRHKLGIANKDINLTSYLNSI